MAGAAMQHAALGRISKLKGVSNSSFQNLGGTWPLAKKIEFVEAQMRLRSTLKLKLVTQKSGLVRSSAAVHWWFINLYRDHVEFYVIA